MHILILAIGLIVGVFALYRFLLKANVQEIKALLASIFVITICIALFYMAVTGRLPAAIALISALAPFAVAYLAKRGAQSRTQPNNLEDPLTRSEALEILGLEDDADHEDIKNAYKKLMKKVHPDQEGSEWMAAKLNAAKDLLLK